MNTLRCIRKALALFFLMPLIWTMPASAESSRAAADRQAKDAFLHLNFFKDGRGMHLVPGIIQVIKEMSRTVGGNDFSDKMLRRHWGLNVQDHWPVGLFEEDYKGLKVGALGCVACHSGKAAGEFVVGLGNKNIDVVKIGQDASLVENLYHKIDPLGSLNPVSKEVETSALEFAKTLSDTRLGNLTQGLVPVSFVRAWFYKEAKVQVPDSMTRGAVKVPFLWGYGEKKKIGQFCDGFGVGDLPGWAVAVELTAGQTPETVRAYRPKVEAAENLFSAFLPPPYPFTVDRARAARGQVVFEHTCQRCHGHYQYDADGLPVYEAPRWIPLAIVGTDSDRLDSNTPEFQKLVEENPLNDLIQAHHYGRGYFAPRLVGVWSRFPYLHNGSVPNIKSLLTPPALRPKIFSLVDAGELYRFDQDNLGLTVPATSSFQEDELRTELADESADSQSRAIYDTEKPGQSNQGHPFGVNLSQEDKRNLMEYLKTL